MILSWVGTWYSNHLEAEQRGFHVDFHLCAPKYILLSISVETEIGVLTQHGLTDVIF